MESPLIVVLINMGKASDSRATNPERAETVRLILEDERPDIVFGQEILPRKPKWLPDVLSYDWRVTGSETAIVWNSELFKDAKEIDQGMKEKITAKMTAPGKSWASDAATLGRVPARITIVGLVHKSSKTRVLAVSWHGPHKMTTVKKKTTFKALQDFCIEVRDQLFKSTETRIVIGGDFNLCLDEVKPEAKFVVESYEPSPRRKHNVIDYFVHTKDVKMKDMAPIVNVRGPVAAPEKPGSSIVKKDKEGEKDLSPDRPDKAGTSSAQASMSHDLEKDPSPDRPDKAGVSSAQASMSHDPVKDPSPDRPDKAGVSSAQASMSHDPVYKDPSPDRPDKTGVSSAQASMSHDPVKDPSPDRPDKAGTSSAQASMSHDPVKDPSPDRPDKAGTSSAQASMSHDPVNASTSKEKGISSSKQTAQPSTKKITSGVLGGPSDHSRSFSTSASPTELCLDHDPLKAKLIINP